MRGILAALGGCALATAALGCDGSSSSSTGPYRDGAAPVPMPCVVSAGNDVAALCAEAGITTPVEAGLGYVPMSDAALDGEGGMDAGTDARPVTDAGPDANVTPDASTGTEAGAPDGSMPTSCPVTASARITCAGTVTAAEMGHGGDGTSDAVLLAEGATGGVTSTQLATLGATASGTSEILPSAVGVGALSLDGANVPSVVFASSTSGGGGAIDLATKGSAGWPVQSLAQGPSAHVYGGATDPSGAWAALFAIDGGLQIGVRTASTQPPTLTVLGMLANSGAYGSGSVGFDGASGWRAAFSDGSGRITVAAGSAPGVDLFAEMGATVFGLGARADATVVGIRLTSSEVSVVETVFASGDARMVRLGRLDIPTACNVSSLSFLSCSSCPVGRSCQADEEIVLDAAIARTADGALWLVQDSMTDVATYTVEQHMPLGGFVCTCDSARGAVAGAREWLSVAPLGADGSLGRGWRTQVTSSSLGITSRSIRAEGRGTTLHILRPGADVTTLQVIVVDTSALR